MKIYKNAKPFIVMMFPGPRYNIESDLRERVEHLSDKFQGLVFTVSNRDAEYTFGDFKILTIDSKKPASWFTAARLLLFAIEKTKSERKIRGKVSLITTYDPTKTGFSGVVMKWIFGARLLVEVNGDYAGEDNYIDMKEGFSKKLKIAVMRRLERFVLKKASGAKLLYPTQLDYFLSDIEHLKIGTFPNYVDVSNFRVAEQEKVVLFVGFPLLRKGVDLLVEAFKQIHPLRKDWKLKILGWFPDRSQLDALIKGCEGIEYHPPVDRSRMPEILGSASILVLPSRSEAMGRILVEAAASGVVRLGSNSGGIPTVITDGKDGMLFESKNVLDLQSKLLILMDDAELRSKLAKEAMRNVGEEGPYGRKQFYLKTMELYENVITAN